MLHGPQVHSRGPKKHPLDYLEHFHWAVVRGFAYSRDHQTMGPERILFSSDYPHGDTPWPESVVGMKQALSGFSAADQDKVMWQNAARLLHL